jgi:hypothetical protein
VRGVAKTPATDELFEINEKSKNLAQADAEEFHHVTAQLLYLGKRARPDILLAVSFLATRVNSPTEEDMEKLARVLRYLQGSVDLIMNLTADSVSILAMPPKSQARLDWLADRLRDSYKEIKVHSGDIHDYLGMDLDFSVPGKCKVSQKKYVQEVLASHPVRGVAKTPATDELFEINEKSKNLAQADAEEFHHVTAQLLYLGKRARPDILLAVSFLATRVNLPTEEDMEKLARVLRYLQGSVDLIMNLTADSVSILAYIDASYGIHIDMRSQSGIVISLGQGPVFAASAKQKLNSKSSTESELIAISDGLSQLLWTRNFLESQGCAVPPARLFQDNLSTKALAEKGRSTSARTRHINIRFFFVKDCIDRGELVVEYLPTKEMISDILTKPTQGSLFVHLRKLLLNLQE